MPYGIMSDPSGVWIAHALPFLAPFFLVLVFWSIAWKGWALWIAARNKHQIWFIVLLVVNTLAILEIIYIFAIGRPALKKSMGGADAGTSSPAK